MRSRIAKVHEHAVAHVFRYEPAERLHRLGDALLIGGDDLAQVLRVHTRRECCRTDEVREHDRDLTTLGSVLGLRLNYGDRLRDCLISANKLANGREHLSPMAKGHTDVL